jgi:hypothetical protein
MITSYAIGWNAGQNLVLENVSGMSDRLLPFGADTPVGNRPHKSGDGIQKTQLDAVLNFLDGTFLPQGPETLASTVDESLISPGVTDV